jgi:hypothetical protein
MHTGREGMSAMPYFDDFDLSTVDILLISQYVNPFLAQRCHFSTFGKHLGELEAVYTKGETKDVAVTIQAGFNDQYCISSSVDQYNSVQLIARFS